MFGFTESESGGGVFVGDARSGAIGFSEHDGNGLGMMEAEMLMLHRFGDKGDDTFCYMQVFSLLQSEGRERMMTFVHK